MSLILTETRNRQKRRMICFMQLALCGSGATSLCSDEELLSSYIDSCLENLDPEEDEFCA